VGRHPHASYWHSVTLGLAPHRPSRVPSLRNVRARRRRPTYALACVRYASPLEQGLPRAKLELVALDGVGLQTCSRRVCRSTAGHEGSGHPAFALSRRRCRAVSYTSSETLRLTNMLLSPRPFGFRSVVRLGVFALNSGHLRWPFTPCVTRRTVSRHPAHALRNPLAGASPDRCCARSGPPPW
jgi:hypothetical protein